MTNNLKIGINKINFYTTPQYIDMVDLAHARDEDPNKYLIGIGQSRQAVIPNTQDAVTLAANAAEPILSSADRQKIDLIVFGTENGVDNSKSAAIYLQHLLRLSNHARAFEVKQACYGATAGLQIAVDYLNNHPEREALVIGSDIARYGLKTPGEVTQGGGAVAMVVSAHPRIITLNGPSAFYSKDIMDFWRPLGKTNALVDGHYSNDIYVNFFKKTFASYLKKTGLRLADFKAIIFHLPYSKMGLKGLRTVLPKASSAQRQTLLNEFHASAANCRMVGNLYTGSLYLSFESLIDRSGDLRPGDRIGFFSYGSGAQGEFYSGILQHGFRNSARKHRIAAMLNHRQRISIQDYERIYRSWLPVGKNNVILPINRDPAQFVFGGVKNYRRVYQRRERK